MLIPHDQFGRLRLIQFLSDVDATELGNWEFENQLWIGEAHGFSEWLRPEDDPEVLRSLAIDFATFPAHAAKSVLRTIDLPVRRGMSLEDLDRLFGPRIAEYSFADDRLTCDYFTPKPNHYRVSCTVLSDSGLSYLVVMIPPIGDRDASE